MSVLLLRIPKGSHFCKKAGLTCFAIPNEFSAGNDFCLWIEYFLVQKNCSQKNTLFFLSRRKLNALRTHEHPNVIDSGSVFREKVRKKSCTESVSRTGCFYNICHYFCRNMRLYSVFCEGCSSCSTCFNGCFSFWNSKGTKMAKFNIVPPTKIFDCSAQKRKSSAERSGVICPGSNRTNADWLYRRNFSICFRKERGVPAEKTANLTADNSSVEKKIDESLRFILFVCVWLPNNKLLMKRIRNLIRVSREYSFASDNTNTERFEFCAILFFRKILAKCRKMVDGIPFLPSHQAIFPAHPPQCSCFSEAT